MTGPDLLLAAEDYCRATNEVGSDPRRNFELMAEPPVERDDGRFYIPVSVCVDGQAVRPPMLRVSTDAFEGDGDDKVNRAIEFACDLTARWNRGPC